MYTFEDITAYLTLSKSFVKDLNPKELFSLQVYSGNADFGIQDKAYLLCIPGEPKDGDLVVLKMDHCWWCRKAQKMDNGWFLIGKNGNMIVDTATKFGLVKQIFNLPDQKGTIE
jgi:hypothetical protein